MLMKIAKSGGSHLVLTLLGWGLLAGNAASLAQAQQAPAEPSKTIDLQFEVWEIDQAVMDDWETEGKYEGHLVRMGMLGSFQELQNSDKKPKPTPPSRFSLRIKDDHYHLQHAMDTSTLRMEFKLIQGGRDEMTLDYEMVRRTKQGEVKVSAKQSVKFGHLLMQWIKPQPADDKANPEKAWLVFISPRQRNADGSEVVVSVDAGRDVNPFGVAFIPRPGRFEMQVSEGWSAQLLANSMGGQLALLSGTTNVGKSKDARASDNHVRLEVFQAERPVLEVVYTDDGFIQVVARRAGVATLTYQTTGLNGKATTCDLQIIVAADTTEIDRTIHNVLPQARIKVSNIKEAALLTGTVANEDDIKLLLEVAEQFYPKIINRVKVAAVEVNDAKERPRHGDLVNPPTGVSATMQTSGTSLPAPGLPATDTEPRRIIPTTNGEAPRNRPRRRDAAELKALHEDVRGLRDDVRRLSELLEKRLAQGNQPPPAKNPNDDDPKQRDRVRTQVRPNGLLSFTAAWCQPCQKMLPLVRKLANEGHAVQTIDVDEDAELARQFHVDSIPCFIRIKEGREVDRMVGMVEEQKLRSLLSDQRRSEKYLPKVQAALQKTVSLDFQANRLRDVIRKISEKIDVNCVLDPQSLEEAGRTPNDLVTITIKDISARSALQLILEPLNLAFVAEDEVLKIVSRQRAKGEMTVVTYSVADVLPLLPDDDAKSSVKPRSSDDRNAEGLDRLIQIIQSTVSPESWDVMGGPASVRAHASTQSLVVRQTADVHAELQELLQQIRRLKQLPKSVSKNDDRSLVVKTYAVADLVIPLPGEPGDRTKPGAADWMKLIDQITEIEPDRWTANGGPCSIDAIEKTLSLVIRATPAMHESTADLLNRMRRDQDVQVSVAIRLLQVADDLKLQKAGLKFDFDPRTGAARLNEREVKQLIAAHNELNGDVLFAPKITIFSGQIAHVGSDDSRDPIDRRPGFQIHVRGQVAKDGSGVRLNVALNPESLVNELIRNSHLVPDGGYLLFDMTDRLAPSKQDADLNGDIEPRAKPKGRVLVLVQPHIIVQEEIGR